MSNSKNFLTGAAGMTGLNIARSLVEGGAAVVGIDNFWRGTHANIADLLTKPKFHFRHADINSDRDWYFNIEETSAITHTADIVAGIGYVFAGEWSVFQKNVLINTSIAWIVTERRPAPLIYLGTSRSYPQTLQRSVESSVLSEAVQMPADPEYGYGWSKLIGEIEFGLAIKDRPTKLVVLDLHNVYGWPCDYGDSTAQVIPSLNKALTCKDRKLSVWGDGNQGRAFLHVSDVVAGVEASLKYAGKQPVFLLGTAHCTTIGEVARLIQSHPRIHIDEIVFDRSKPTGDLGRFSDAGLAARELGWAPKVESTHGLFDMIDHVIADSNQTPR